MKRVLYRLNSINSAAWVKIGKKTTKACKKQTKNKTAFTNRGLSDLTDRFQVMDLWA